MPTELSTSGEERLAPPQAQPICATRRATSGNAARGKVRTVTGERLRVAAKKAPPKERAEKDSPKERAESGATAVDLVRTPRERDFAPANAFDCVSTPSDSGSGRANQNQICEGKNFEYENFEYKSFGDEKSGEDSDGAGPRRRAWPSVEERLRAVRDARDRRLEEMRHNAAVARADTVAPRPHALLCTGRGKLTAIRDRRAQAESAPLAIEERTSSGEEEKLLLPVPPES